MYREALVVGINTYQHCNHLTAPAENAEALAQGLSRNGHFRIHRLPETMANGQQIMARKVGVSVLQLKRLLVQLFQPDQAQVPEVGLFYFSGYAYQVSEGSAAGSYLVTSDSNPKRGNYGLPLQWLRQLVAESPISQHVIWLDCCHSGHSQVNLAEASVNAGQAGRSGCFISSGCDFEANWQDPDSSFSWLSKTLLKGLTRPTAGTQRVNSDRLVDYVRAQHQHDFQQPFICTYGQPIALAQPAHSPVAAAPQATLPNHCPYQGLQAFECNDIDPQYFYGREALTAQLLTKLQQNNFLALVGTVGSGKSSVLRAGVLAQLRSGHLIEQSDQWQIQIMQPGQRPLQQLAIAWAEPHNPHVERAETIRRVSKTLSQGELGLTHLVEQSLEQSAAPRVLLVIDQFEELFSLCRDRTERERFLATLLTTVDQLPEHFSLIIAMQAEALGDCLAEPYFGLADRIQQARVMVRSLAPAELEAALAKPAEQAGLSVEASLKRQILVDAERHNTPLPLIQYCFLELWRQQRDRKLQFSTYQISGRITHSLDKRATAIYRDLPPQLQATAKHIFLALVQHGPRQQFSCQAVLQHRLINAYQAASAIQEVIEVFATARLLTLQEVVQYHDHTKAIEVRIAHASLVEHWSLLNRWLAERQVGQAKPPERQITNITTTSTVRPISTLRPTSTPPKTTPKITPSLTPRRGNVTTFQPELQRQRSVRPRRRTQPPPTSRSPKPASVKRPQPQADRKPIPWRSQIRAWATGACWLLVPVLVAAAVGEYILRERQVQQHYT
ncbi:MAG: caspase family protein, partial [Cyanobacteria bacterium P01_H01_bin.121]